MFRNKSPKPYLAVVTEGLALTVCRFLQECGLLENLGAAAAAIPKTRYTTH